MQRAGLRWLGLVAAGVAPFLAIELVLRLVGLPRPDAPYLAGFEPDQPILARAGDGVEVLPELRRAWRAQPFPAEPAPGVLRLFAVGDSVTWGHRGNEFPEPLAAWPDVLESLLRQRRSPGRDVVVNLGARTFGSGRVAGVARQALAWRPDVLLVNVGTSEHLEHDLGAEVRRRRWLADVRLVWALETWLRPAGGGLTLGQLAARDGALRAAFVRPESRLGGAAARADLLAASERNLGAIVEACRGQGVPVALATVPANLRYPPFATRFEPEEARVEGEAAITRAGELLDAGRAAEALALVSPLASRHPEAAGLHYREAQARDALGDPAGARAAYERALEVDDCPARAFSAYNALVRRLAAEQPGVRLVDQDRVFREAVADGIPDGRLFLDACHPTEAMQARMAEEWYAVLDQAGWLAPRR